MADDLSVALDRLRTSAQRLNTAIDAAGQLIKATESFLETNGIGLDAKVRVQTDEDAKKQLTHWDLEYRTTVSGKYRIIVAVRHNQAVEPTWSRPWSECNRETKLVTIKKLPDLLAELTKEVERRAEQAERTVAAVTGQLPSLKKKKGGA